MDEQADIANKTIDHPVIRAFIQARMSSTRFPGKVLHKIEGKPLLQYLLESLGQCSRLDKVVVATSLDPSDDPVAWFCRDFGTACFRGPLGDVAGRFLEAAQSNGLDAFVRVNGDSPLLDYRLVDRAVSLFLNGKFDLVTNILKRTYPKGQSVEVVRFDTFKMIYPRFRNDAEREHVTSFFYNHGEKFAIHNFESGKQYGTIQLSVDTPEDMRHFKAIVVSMKKPHWEYSFEDTVRLSQSFSNMRKEA
jgi:spore coat polysaccharide biosynthesis protein SpsF